MAEITRREMLTDAMSALVTYSLLETLMGSSAFADAVKPTTVRWLADVDALGRDVKGQSISQTEWQKKVEALFATVDLPDLLRMIDFEKLSKGLALPNNGARSLNFRFPKVEGLPTNYIFGKQIFALRKDRSVVPHGHNNMATAFLILGGNLRGRHYDRVKDEPDHYLIRPTIDRDFGPGETSSVSDLRDNVHWFKANAEPSYIFNIHVLGVDPKGSLPTGRVYLDPQGEKVSGGLIRARRVEYSEAHRLYG